MITGHVSFHPIPRALERELISLFVVSLGPPPPHVHAFMSTVLYIKRRSKGVVPRGVL